MQFDADKEAVKITTMATDLMAQNPQSMQREASCNLMNEWHNLSADEKNATWNSLKNEMPSDERKEDPKTETMHLNKSDNIFGALVTGDIRANGDAFGLEFHGDNGISVNVMNFSDRNSQIPAMPWPVRTEKRYVSNLTFCQKNYGYDK